MYCVCYTYPPWQEVQLFDTNTKLHVRFHCSVVSGLLSAFSWPCGDLYEQFGAFMMWPVMNSLCMYVSCYWIMIYGVHMSLFWPVVCTSRPYKTRPILTLHLPNSFCFN